MTATHVIIRGHIYPRAEKEPFVASGKSILGAVEYDRERDLLKCHECGGWFTGLSSHVYHAHRIVPRAYKQAHGLRQATALVACRVRATVSRKAVARGQRVQAAVQVGPRLPRDPMVGKCYAEKANEKGRCKAQTLFDLQKLAATLGRTPTQHEMEEIGIYHSSLKVLFGMPVRAILAWAGMPPRKAGENDVTGPRRRISDEELLESLKAFYREAGRIPTAKDASAGKLPAFTTYRRAFGNMRTAYQSAGIPRSAWAHLASKEHRGSDRWNERMPWPEEYFHPQPRGSSSLIAA